MRFMIVGCLFVACITSCSNTSPEPNLETSSDLDLELERATKRQAILTDILGTGTALDHVTAASGMVGHDINEYGELFDLADSLQDDDDVTEYYFGLEGVSQNEEGWATLVVSVNDNCITDTYIMFPEW